MTTLETNPIAFFFSPLSSTPVPSLALAGPGIEVLSMRPTGKPRWSATQVANVPKAQRSFIRRV